MTMSTSLKHHAAPVLAALAWLPMLAHADWSALNLPRGVTPYSREVYDLHMLVLWICVGIGVVVFGAIRSSLFAPDGVLRFEGVPVGPFVGRAAIAAAYDERPPDDTEFWVRRPATRRYTELHGAS